MVAIVAGSGLGLLETTINQAQGAGVLGNGSLGQAKGSASVNLSTGNLILQFTDETISGRGSDIKHLRTYNSLGATSDGDSDRWRWLGEKRVRLIGNLNSFGSRVVRTTGDGHEAEYRWNGSVYVSSDGRGANDYIIFSGNEWLWTEGSSRTKERYDASTGWINSVRDINGNGFDYTFSNNLLTRVTDVASGQTLDLIYSDNKLARVDTRETLQGSATKQVYYLYDEVGRLSEVQTDLSLDNSTADKHIYTTSYTYYDKSTHIESITQSDGTRVVFSYIDDKGTYKVSSVTDQSGTTKFNYHDNRTDVTNSEGETVRYFHDKLQRLVKVESEKVDGLIQSAKYEYDNQNNVTRVFDGQGNAVSYFYDNASNLIRSIDALGNVVERSYNSDNRVVTETQTVNGSAQTTRYVYDVNGNTRFIVSAEGHVAENTYANGLVIKSIQYSQAKYDVSGLSSTQVLSESQLQSWVSQVNQSNTQLVDFEYDYRGNLTKKIAYGLVDSQGNGVLDNSATRTDYVYSAYGELTQTISVTGESRDQFSTIESRAYDGMGRLIAVLDDGGTTATTYGKGQISTHNRSTGLTVTSAFDDTGKLISLTKSGDGQNRITRYYYDDAGRQRMTEDAEGNRAYTFYDRAGRVSYQVSGTGAVSGFSYDENGQITVNRQYHTQVDTSNWFNGTTVTINTFIVASHHADRLTRYTYDKAGRLDTTTQQLGLDKVVTQSVYDSASQLVSSTLAGDRVTKHYYDKDGRTIGVLDAERYLSENVYDNAGRLISTIKYNRQVSLLYQGSATFSELKAVVANAEKLSTHFFYDSQGRQVGVVNNQGFLTETEYNIAGRKTYTHSYLTALTLRGSDTLASLRARAGDKQTDTQVFDTLGRLERNVAYDGTQTRYLYDRVGRLAKIIAAEGTQDETASRTRYNAFGEVTGVVSGVGEAAITDLNTAIDRYGKAYRYDNLGRKIYEEGPQGQKTFFYYDRDNRISYIVNALGEVSKTAYNAFGQTAITRVLNTRINTTGLTGGNENSLLVGRVNAAINDDKDQTTHTSYNTLGLVSTQTDAEGAVTRYNYNRYGDLTDIYTPFSTGVTSRQHFVFNHLGQATHTYSDYDGIRALTRAYYDGFGRIVRTTDANGNDSLTEYRENGRMIVVRDALNQSRSTRYDAFGRELEVIDAAGQVTRYTYDDRNRKTSVTTPEGIVISSWQTRLGQTLQVSDGNGHITQYAYDKNGNVKTVTDHLGQVTTHTYDNSGRLFETLDANGHAVRFIYDLADRIVEKRVDPNGLNIRTKYLFDGQGRTIEVRDGYGTQEERQTQFVFDRNGRLEQQIIDPNGLALSTRYRYNEAGHQVRVERGTVTEPGQQVVEYRYDKLGRKIEQILDPGTDKLNISTHYRYDKNGNLTRTIDAKQNSTWFIYNSLNQQTYRVNALGHVTGYDYHANGQLSQTREYVNVVSTDSWDDVVDHVNVTLHDQDRRTYQVLDKDGRIRFTLTAANENWIVSENRLDHNGNAIEVRQFDRAIKQSTIDAISQSGSDAGNVVTEAEVVQALQSLGYRDQHWGDNHIQLFDSSRTHFAYDKLNRLRFTVDALGYLTETQYDSVGNIRYEIQYGLKPNNLNDDYSEQNIKNQLRSSSTLDRIQERRYDAADRLTEELSATATVTASDGIDYTGRIKHRTHYDALGQVIQREEGIIERVGHADITVDRRSATFVFDKAGRQIASAQAGWYDATDKKVYQNQDGQADRFQVSTAVLYDALGNAVKNTVRVGVNDYIEQYKVYDALGRELYDVDALGYISGKTYDALGRIQTETRYSTQLNVTPRSGVWSASQIDRLTLFDDKKRTATHTYDQLGQKTGTVLDSVNNYAPSSSATAFNPSSASVYQGAPETQLEYNRFGELVKQRDKLDATRWSDSYFYYDRMGRRTHTVDAEKYVTKTQYDVFSNVVDITEYANKAVGDISVGPSPADLPVVSGHTNDRVLAFSYDRKGQQLSATHVGVSFLDNDVWQTGNIIVQENQYNAFGEVIESSDALQNITSYQFNRLGLMTRITEPQRTVASTEVNPFNNTVVVRPETSYTYNVFGQIISETRAANTGRGETITLANQYDHNGNQIRTTDGEGHHTRFEVDSSGRVIRQLQDVDVSASSSSASWMSYAHTIERRFAYDKVGRQTATLDVYDGKQAGNRQIFNSFGEVVREEKVWGDQAANLDSLNTLVAANHTYDQAGRVILTRDNSGYTHYYYDLQSHVTRVEQRGATDDISGARITENYYDLLGRTRVQRLPYYTGTFVSSSTGNQSSTVLRPVRQQFYDRWGNVTKNIDPAGYATDYTYNHANQLSTEIGEATSVFHKDTETRFDAKAKRTIQYDSLGRVGKETFQAIDARNDEIVETKYRRQYYDEANNLIQTVDATEKSLYSIYDIHGNKVGTRDGIGITKVMDYDKRGLLTKNSILRDGQLEETQGFYYDQAGRKYSETTAQTRRTNYQRDERGNIVLRIEPGARRTRYVYDELGNKTAEEKKVTVTYTERVQLPPYGGPSDHPRYIDRTVYKDVWVGDNFEYQGADYNINQLKSRSYVTKIYPRGALDRAHIGYTYNRFAQVDRETDSVNSAWIQYSYWQNGLLKRKTTSENILSKARKVESNYYYDVRGNRTIEDHMTIDKTTRTVDGVSFTADIYYTMRNEFKYDVLGRIASVKSPKRTFRTNDGEKTSTTLVGLSYTYDVWGNRREIKAEYTPPGIISTGYTEIKTDTFKYDSEGRLLKEYIKHGSKTFTYDAAGRRATETTYVVTPGEYGAYGSAGMPTVEHKQKQFFYNDMGQIVTVRENKHFGVYNDYRVIEQNTYDKYGYKTESIINLRRTETSYSHEGKITGQKNYDLSGNVISSLHSYKYHDLGYLEGYKFQKHATGGFYPSSGYTHTYVYTYQSLYNGNQVSRIKLHSTQSGVVEGDTYNFNDYFGGLTHSRVTEFNFRGTHTGFSHKYFAYNSDAQVVASVYRQFESSVLKLQNFYAVGGNSLASIGHDKVDISPLDSFNTGDDAPGTYTISTGDTLTGIAQAMFGDGSLWYIIAEANGLEIGPTQTFGANDVGRVLNIPNVAQSVKNTANTFKPYNHGEAIGDLTPSPGVLPPPKVDQCKKITAIVIMAVVAAAITIASQGAAAGLVGSTLAKVIGAGVGGFVGSLAAQQVGVWMGVQDKVDLGSAATNGVTSALTAGIGDAAKAGKAAKELSALGKLRRVATVASAKYFAKSTVNNIVKGDSSFNWKSFAVSVGTSVVTAGLKNNVDLLKPDNAGEDYVGLFQRENFIGRFSDGLFTASARYGVSSLIEGKNKKRSPWQEVVADAFGNALGASLGSGAKKLGGAIVEKIKANKKAKLDAQAKMHSSSAAVNVSVEELEKSNQMFALAGLSASAKSGVGDEPKGLSFADLENVISEFAAKSAEFKQSQQYQWYYKGVEKFLFTDDNKLNRSAISQLKNDLNWDIEVFNLEVDGAETQFIFIDGYEIASQTAIDIEISNDEVDRFNTEAVSDFIADDVVSVTDNAHPHTYAIAPRGDGDETLDGFIQKRMYVPVATQSLNAFDNSPEARFKRKRMEKMRDYLGLNPDTRIGAEGDVTMSRIYERRRQSYLIDQSDFSDTAKTALKLLTYFNLTMQVASDWYNGPVGHKPIHVFSKSAKTLNVSGNKKGNYKYMPLNKSNPIVYRSKAAASKIRAETFNMYRTHQAEVAKREIPGNVKSLQAAKRRFNDVIAKGTRGETYGIMYQLHNTKTNILNQSSSSTNSSIGKVYIRNVYGEFSSVGISSAALLQLNGNINK